MRITRESLLKIAKETVAQMVRARRSLVAVHVIGSLGADEPLLGGTTDIDLVCIHASEPPAPREITRLSADVSLDMAHHNQSIYRVPRHLRLDPWLGPAIYGTRLVLHDAQHFFEFTQASVGAQFMRADNVIARARQFYQQARAAWLALQSEDPATLNATLTYLEAASAAANAIASLNGAPLTGRRFLLQFPQRAAAAGKPGLAAGLVGLIGGDHATPEMMRDWLPQWRSAYAEVEALPSAPVSFAPFRRAYYEHAHDALLASDQPVSALWSLFHTWTRLVACLPAGAAPVADWVSARAQIGLDAAHAEDKLAALDAYLDMVEETLEGWARDNGVWSE